MEAFFALILWLGLGSPEPKANSVTIEIHNLDLGSGGHLALALFDNESAFDARKSPIRRAYVPIEAQTFEWSLGALPPGRYAATAYQDSNGNRVLDRGRLGIPKEPYGFSRNARGRFGPPSFADALIELPTSGSRLRVDLGGFAASPPDLKKEPSPFLIDRPDEPPQ